MKVVITRPLEDAVPLAILLRSFGHEMIIEPLLRIVPRENIIVPTRNYQAICLTSANGIRALSDIAALLHFPVLAVGPQSHQAAVTKGFAQVKAKGGDVDGLVHYITENLNPNGGPLLYISGSETSGDLEGKLKTAHFEVERVQTYDAFATEHFDNPNQIAAADAVLLYSPRSAKLWLKAISFHMMLDQAALIHHICLSANIAACLPQSWLKHVALHPTEQALIAMLDQISKAE